MVINRGLTIDTINTLEKILGYFKIMVDMSLEMQDAIEDDDYDRVKTLLKKRGEMLYKIDILQQCSSINLIKNNEPMDKNVDTLLLELKDTVKKIEKLDEEFSRDIMGKRDRIAREIGAVIDGMRRLSLYRRGIANNYNNLDIMQ